AFFVRPGPKPARRRLPSKQPFSIGFLPLHPEAALLLRSGRRASSPAFGSNVPISPSPAQRDKGLFSSHRQQRPEPALLLRSGRRWREAPDEGASEASCCCSSRQHQRHASLRSRPLIRLRAPSPASGRRASSPAFGSNVPISPSPAQRDKGLFSSHRQQRPEPALLLRSGRRWREAPDEGASEASCSCPSQATSKARFAALAPPHPPSGHLL